MFSLVPRRSCDGLARLSRVPFQCRTVTTSFASTQRWPQQPSGSSRRTLHHNTQRPFSTRGLYQQNAPQSPARAPSPPNTSTTTNASKATIPKAQAADSGAPDTPTARPPSTTRSTAAAASTTPIQSISSTGFDDLPATIPDENSAERIDWTRSYHGMSEQAFSPEAQAILMAPLESNDVEVKPDGIVYLPEIKYRRILNRAFGPGGWALAPRGDTIVTAKSVTREYALLVQGRLVSIARGEQDYFDPEGIPTASEGCKSNALVRCCKDLGVASELWDPRYIRKYIAEHTREAWVEHVVSKKRRKIWIRKDDTVLAPFKEVKGLASTQ